MLEHYIHMAGISHTHASAISMHDVTAYVCINPLSYILEGHLSFIIIDFTFSDSL